MVLVRSQSFKQLMIEIICGLSNFLCNYLTHIILKNIFFHKWKFCRIGTRFFLCIFGCFVKTKLFTSVCRCEMRNETNAATISVEKNVFVFEAFQQQPPCFEIIFLREIRLGCLLVAKMYVRVCMWVEIERERKRMFVKCVDERL